MKRLVCLTILAAIGLPTLADGATSRVGVEDDFFSVSSLSVAKGAKVKWIWRGSNKHNVVVKTGPRKFQSPLQKTGTFKYRFKKRGTYSLVCTVHTPEMAMTVSVR